MSTSTNSRGQVIWRSRRGLLELDLYLTPFAERCFDDLSSNLQRQYVALLECEDPEILDWLKGGAKIPPEREQIVAKIIEFVRCKSSLDTEE